MTFEAMLDVSWIDTGMYVGMAGSLDPSVILIGFTWLMTLGSSPSLAWHYAMGRCELHTPGV